MTGKPLRIILVDDHAVVRMGYKRLLENDPDIEVIAELESGEEANQQARELNPDVMVMDLSMPGMGGAGSHSSNQGEESGDSHSCLYHA